MTDDTTKATLRAEALKVGEHFGLRDPDLVALLDLSDASIEANGRITGVTEALVAMRKAKPHFFGLSSKSASEMTVEERIKQLEQIRDRDRQRQARRNAPPVLAPGETRKSAKDMSKAEYAATLAAIKRRGN